MGDRDRSRGRPAATGCWSWCPPTRGPRRGRRRAAQAVRRRLRGRGRRTDWASVAAELDSAPDRRSPWCWPATPAASAAASSAGRGRRRATRRRCGRAWCAGASWTSPSRCSRRSAPGSSTPGCSGRRLRGTRSSTSAVTELLDEWASRNGSGVRGGPADRRAVGAAVHRAAGHVHPQPRADRFLRRELARKAGSCSASLGLADPELPVVVLRFRPNRPVLTNPNAMEIAAAFGLLDSLATRAAVRRRGDRRRTGRAECGGVRRVGGAAYGRARAAGHGWAGRHQLADPQLPGVPARHQRRPAGGQRVPAGLVLRRDVPLVPLGGRTSRSEGDLRVLRLSDGSAVRSRTVVVATGAEWRRLGRAAAGGAAGPRRVLRCGGQRGPGDDREERLRARRRQLGRPGRGLPLPVRPAGDDPGPPACAGRDDVDLPAPEITRARRTSGADPGRGGRRQRQPVLGGAGAGGPGQSGTRRPCPPTRCSS